VFTFTLAKLHLSSADGVRDTWSQTWNKQNIGLILQEF